MAVRGSERITFGTAVFIALTSMIGAGIFIKTQVLHTLAHNQLGPVVCLLFLFLLNIFSFLYVLIRIIPEQTGDMGFVEWSKSLCPKRLHEYFCNFVRFFYHPLSLVVFSIYGVSGLIGVGRNIESTFVILFFSAFVVFLFMVIRLLSFEWAHKIQLCLWILVLIPLILLPIIGFFSPAPESNNIVNPNKSTGLDSLGPWMILISGLPSVLFIYDGFYGLASLKSKLSSSSMLAGSLVVGFLLVTLIYLYVIIGFSLGDPKAADYRNFGFFRGNPIFSELFEILVSFASLLTLNSIILANIPQLVAMQKEHHHPEISFLKTKILYKKPADEDFEDRFSIFVYLLAQSIFWFFVVGILGFFLRKAIADGFLVIVDAIADMLSIGIFTILVAVILRSLKNYRNSKDYVWFRVCAIISSSFILLAIGYLVVSYIVGLTGYAGASKAGSAMKLLFLLIFLCGSCYNPLYFWVEKLFKRRRSILFPPFRKNGMITIR